MNSGKVRRIIPSIPISAIIPYLAAAAVILLISPATAAPPLLFPERLPRIAIDPGHGGADGGAQGPTGHLEKAITLELARKLTLKLETHYEVILTRSDDYSLAPRQRSAIANQAKADVYIGIHTGAGFLHGTNSMTVYYYSPMKSGANLPPDAGGTHDRQHWDRAQMGHKDASISLATALNKNLEKMAGTSGCKILSAPLILLEGANMPAVLVEVGHITNPATEKNLSSSQGIEMLTHAIEQGIEEYIKSYATSRRP